MPRTANLTKELDLTPQDAARLRQLSMISAARKCEALRALPKFGMTTFAGVNETDSDLDDKVIRGWTYLLEGRDGAQALSEARKEFDRLVEGGLSSPGAPIKVHRQPASKGTPPLLPAPASAEEAPSPLELPPSALVPLPSEAKMEEPKEDKRKRDEEEGEEEKGEPPKMTRTYAGEPQATFAADDPAPKPSLTSGVQVPEDVVETYPKLEVKVGLSHVPSVEDYLTELQTLVNNINVSTEWICKLERDGACAKRIEQEVCNLLLLLCEGDKFEEKAGTHPVNLATEADAHPLHTAAFSAAPQTLNALLTFPKTDPSVKNCCHQTALQLLLGQAGKDKAAPECVNILVDAILKRDWPAPEFDKNMDVPLEEIVKARADGADLHALLTKAHMAKMQELKLPKMTHQYTSGESSKTWAFEASGKQ